MRCAGETYVNTYVDEEGKVETVAECNGGSDGDCRWEIPYPFDLDCGITSMEMAEVHELHLAHSRDAA